MMQQIFQSYVEAPMTPDSRPLSKQDSAILNCLETRGVPLSAYEIGGSIGNPAPTIIYRGLKRLMDRGLVHKVESLRAFMACKTPHDAHCAVLSVCVQCQSVTERPLDQPTVDTKITAIAAQGASVEQVELQVRCENCIEAAA